jgi:ABC-type antimicrobial peptide transport system permease subunit
MDRSYTGTVPPQAPEQPIFWIPMERALSIMMPGVPAQARRKVYSQFRVRGIGRLASGSSPAAATRELNGQFKNEEIVKRPGAKFEVMDHIVQNIFVQRETQRQLQMFLAGSVLLALVAAANVSLFLLARAPGRRRELGIRMAVGAPLKRLGRQLASEATVLVIAAAVLGLTLSIWLAKFLRGLSFLRQAQWRDVTLLDWRVLGLVGVFLLLVTLLVSLAPIAGLKRLGIAASSRLVSARATVAQRIAGTMQIAVAGTLAGAAIAFTWHLARVLTADPGYRTQGVYAVAYSLTTAGRGISINMGRDGKVTVGGVVDAARRHDAFAAIPGVTAVSLASAAPGLPLGFDQTTVADPKDPQHPVRVRSMVLDRHYIELLGLKLVNGQNVRDDDPGGVLVNQGFARRFFGRDDVAGELLPAELRPADPSTLRGGPFVPTLIGATHIVGVVRDLSYQNPLDDIDPMILSPGGVSFAGISILESRLPKAALQKQAQEALRTLDLKMMGDVQSLAKIHSDILAPDRARGLLTITTAVIVVLLAAFGFYGTQRYLVTAGRREYAIRASLGAGPRALGRLVLRRGLMLGLPGLVLGTPLAFIVVAWLRDDYVSRTVSPWIVTLSVVLGLLGLLLLASLGPARFARRTQPAPLLRED